MNLTNMELQELKKLKREIEDEIGEREEKELRELFELAKEYLKARTAPALAVSREAYPTSDGGLISADELAARLGIIRNHVYQEFPR